MKLRPYQTRAVAYVLRNLPRKRSILVQSPVATGKTVIFAELARRYAGRGKRVLVLAHREELIGQARERLESLGLTVGVIKAGHEPDTRAQVQVASVQTLCRRDKRPRADVIIVDEAHHSPAKSYRKIVENYPRALIVGFTATPVHAEPLTDCFAEFYTTIEPKEAVRRGYLAPFTGHVYLSPDMRDVKRVRGDFEQRSAGRAMSRRQVVGDIVGKWLEHARGASTLLYAATVAQSRKTVQAFAKQGVKAEHLDANSPLDERAEVLRRFSAGEFPVLCNVGLFTEGTNIERVKCIVLARPTYSVGLYLQMVGRGRRPWKGQACRIHDHAGLIATHHGPDDVRDWSAGGRSEVRESVVCPACRTARARGVARCENPDCVGVQREAGEREPEEVLRGYEYEIEKFLAEREEKRKEAIERYQGGMSLDKIMSLLAVPRSTVYLWLKQARVKIRSFSESQRKYSDHLITAVCDFYESGGTVESAAQAAGVPEGIAYVWLRQRGIVRSHVETTGLTGSAAARACAAYRSGTSMAEISRDLKVGRGAVLGALKRAKIPLRSQSDVNYLRWERRTRSA